MLFPSRREFLKTAAGGTAVGMGGGSVVWGLPPVSDAEARPHPETVQLRPEIEPLVRFLETTPHAELLDQVARRIKAGLSYRQLLAALLLAGVRNVQPRPSVGFKFHAVLVVNSAHLASLSSPPEDRWLPIFWAIDNFKSSQARDVREGDWTMAPVKESAVPPAHKARQVFTQSMERWDESGVDAAVAGLARRGGATEIFELFARYGARDFRSIGHKAIFVANGWRTLQCIGWRHAEPVVRSLGYALLNHTGEPNPADSDLLPDRPWRENQELATQLRADWQSGKLDSQATEEMLSILHKGSWKDACQAAVKIINRGVAPQSIYDALLAGSGELLMRQPGIVALHAVTSTNALRYAYETVGDDNTRRLLLLQNVAFLPLFRQAMQGRGQLADTQLGELEAIAPEEEQQQTLEAIFHDVSTNPQQAARRTLGYLQAHTHPEQFLNQARRLIFLKGRNSHDYKFSSAVLEDFYNTSPRWRNLYLATSVFKLRGTQDRDSGLVAQTRQALQG